jgi:hypothetical protein
MTDLELRKWCVEQVRNTFVSYKRYHSITPSILAEGAKELYEFMTEERYEEGYKDHARFTHPDNVIIDLNDK